MSIELRRPNPDYTAWDPPEIIQLEPNDTHVVDAWRNQPGIRVLDNAKTYVEELYEVDDALSKGDRESYVEEKLADGPGYGNWAYDPTSGIVEHLPDAQSFYELRTSRFRPRITLEQQRTLGEKRYAALGMSVGSTAVETAFRAGIGSGPGGLTVIVDSKDIKPSNLGRIGTGRHDIGVPKVVSLARRLSALDPYARVVQISKNFDRDTLEELGELDIQAVIEEMDHGPSKTLAREWALDDELPVIMGADLLDASAISVERYDLNTVDGSPLAPFGGRIPLAIFEAMLNGGIKPDGKPLTEQEMMAASVGIAGHSTIANSSPELLNYQMQVNRGEIAGLPQFNTTVGLGGAAIAVALREIFLGRTMNSGTYTIDMREALDLESLVDPQEAAMVRATLRQIATQ